MLRKMQELKGFAIGAKDGDIPEKLSLAYEAKLDGHYREPNYWWC